MLPRTGQHIFAAQPEEAYFLGSQGDNLGRSELKCNPQILFLSYFQDVTTLAKRLLKEMVIFPMAGKAYTNGGIINGISVNGDWFKEQHGRIVPHVGGGNGFCHARRFCLP
jgi:hypothetical protein